MWFTMNQATNPNLCGVVTHSSGNHGQATAWATVQVAKLPCSIVVPKSKEFV